MLTANDVELIEELANYGEDSFVENSFDEQIHTVGLKNTNSFTNELEYSNIKDSKSAENESNDDAADNNEFPSEDKSAYYSNNITNLSKSCWFYLPEGINTDQIASNLEKNSPKSNICQLIEEKMVENNEWNLLNKSLNSLRFTNDDVERLISIYPGVSDILSNCANASNHRNLTSKEPLNNCAHCHKCIITSSDFFIAHINCFLIDLKMFDYYDCNFYCENCHIGQTEPIPRNILYNWNFNPLPVSEITKQFLQTCRTKPWLNIATHNPDLYAVSSVLRQARLLRRTLSLLWIRISNCDLRATLNLTKCFTNRLHFLCPVSDIDIYSIQDLTNLMNGILILELKAAIFYVALNHVLTCTECIRNERVFCDVCKEFDQPIWLYDFTNYYSCSTPGCKRFLHKGCWNPCLDSESLEWKTTKNPTSEDSGPFNRRESLRHMFLTSSGLCQSPKCNHCLNNLKNGLPARLGHYSDPQI